MEHVIEMKEDKIRITPPSTSTPQSASTPPSRTSSSASSTAGSNCSNSQESKKENMKFDSNKEERIKYESRKNWNHCVVNNVEMKEKRVGNIIQQYTYPDIEKNIPTTTSRTEIESVHNLARSQKQNQPPNLKPLQNITENPQDYRPVNTTSRNNHKFRRTDPSSRRTDEDYFIPVFNHSQASLLAKDSNLSVRYQTNGGSTPDLSTNTSGLAAAQQTFRSPAATPHMDRHVHKRHGDRRDRLKYDSLRRERQPGNLIGGNEHPPPSRGPPVPMRTTPCTTQVYNQQLQQQLQQQQLQQQQQLHTQRDTFDSMYSPLSTSPASSTLLAPCLSPTKIENYSPTRNGRHHNNNNQQNGIRGSQATLDTRDSGDESKHASEGSDEEQESANLSTVSCASSRCQELEREMERCKHEYKLQQHHFKIKIQSMEKKHGENLAEVRTILATQKKVGEKWKEEMLGLTEKFDLRLKEALQENKKLRLRIDQLEGSLKSKTSEADEAKELAEIYKSRLNKTLKKMKHEMGR